jgi:hypothetical protein
MTRKLASDGLPQFFLQKERRCHEIYFALASCGGCDCSSWADGCFECGAGVRVNAELTKRIDSKRAKAGETVEARTTSAVKLPDGTELPKGIKLAGKVTDVRARSNTDKTSHIAFNLDQALMKDGHEVPLRVMVMSATAPFDAPPDIAGMTSGSRGSRR